MSTKKYISDSYALIRQIRIDLITGESNHIVDWFNGIWHQIIIVEVNVYHSRGCEFIYYKYIDNKKICIFYQDSNDDFWCNHEQYWKLFPIEDNFTISLITKILIDNALQDMGNTQLIASPWYAPLNNGSPVVIALDKL